MVLRTKPPDIKWLRIVIMVGLGIRGTAYLAYPSFDMPKPHGVAESVSGFIPLRVFCFHSVKRFNFLLLAFRSLQLGCLSFPIAILAPTRSV